MNHSYQRNRLLVQLKSYKDFVPLCSFDDLPKLLAEITKIHSRIELIKSYNLSKLMEEVPQYFETKQSKINHANFKIPNSANTRYTEKDIYRM